MILKCGSETLALMSLLALVGLLREVYCHSWLVCTDYIEKGGSTWKPEKCRGYPRGGHRKAPKNGVFGHDSGFDYLPKNDQACQIKRNDWSEYSQDHPMAVYYPGQQVILVHPMKNHGADIGCTNIHIPDTGNWIYRSERNPRQDPTLSEFRKNLVFDLGRSRTGKDFNGDLSLSSVYPKPGFQNAPKFCENTDKAMATFVMNVPRDIKPGIYTFMWLWAFNSMNNLYSSCFEVEIVKSKYARDNRLIANGYRDTTEPCGGMTSNENIKGNSNEGCTPLVGENGLIDYTYPTMPSFPVTTTSTTYYHLPDTTTLGWRPYPIFTTKRPAYPYEEYDEYDQYNGPAGSYYGKVGHGGSQSYYDYETTGQPQSYYGGEDKISVVDSNVELAMTLLQYSGEINLPAPRSTAVRRYYSIDFDCDVDTANFWNCRVINLDDINAPNSPKRHYEVMQEGDKELNNLHLYYHVNHREPCDILRFPPRAKLTREEYENI